MEYFFAARTQLVFALSLATKSTPESITVTPATVTHVGAASVPVRVIVRVRTTKE
jgi:hypothetical protein